MARILSIDYGKKRTGLAVTDPLQIIAGGLATVPTAQLYDYLVKYISEESVELIVIACTQGDDRRRTEKEGASEQSARR